MVRWLFGAERREDGPPWSVMESDARSVNGTCTCSCAAAAAVRAGAAPGLLAEGSKRYSMSVKRPSGGTKESAFDCAKRFSLCGREGRALVGWSEARRGEIDQVGTNRTQGWKDGSEIVCELVNVRSRSGVPAHV